MNDITDAVNNAMLLENEAATLAAGAQFSQYAFAGLTIYLHGDLGAGKTTFTRGFIQGLGFVGKVKSPTYTLVEPYVLKHLSVYHFDLYRLVDAEEWEAAGFREYFNAYSICMIEWPEKAGHLLPEPDIHVHLLHHQTQRTIQFLAGTEQGQRCLAR